MLYGAAITETTVVRAVLLFYLAPAWSVAIECLFFGRRFRWFNALAFAIALAGVVLIFGGRIDVGGWAIGDTMAIGSGIILVDRRLADFQLRPDQRPSAGACMPAPQPLPSGR